MRQTLQSFWHNEDGAITVDWVVLTAAIIGLQIVLLVFGIQGALEDTSEATGGVIDQYGAYLQ